MSASLRPRVSLERTARVSLVGYNPHDGGSLALSLSYFRAAQTKRLSIDRGRERVARRGAV